MNPTIIMTLTELDNIIKNMPYSISGSQDIGWLIRYNDGSHMRLPVGMDYQTAIKLADAAC